MLLSLSLSPIDHNAPLARSPTFQPFTMTTKSDRTPLPPSFLPRSLQTLIPSTASPPPPPWHYLPALDSRAAAARRPPLTGRGGGGGHPFAIASGRRREGRRRRMATGRGGRRKEGRKGGGRPWFALRLSLRPSVCPPAGRSRMESNHQPAAASAASAGG